MDDDNIAMVLECFAIVSSLGIACVNTKKVVVLDHLVLAKKLGVSHEKTLNMIWCTTQHGVAQWNTILIMMVQDNWGQGDYHLTCEVIHSLPTWCLEVAISVHRYLPLILVCHSGSPWSGKARLMKHCSYSFSWMRRHLQSYVIMPRRLVQLKA